MVEPLSSIIVNWRYILIVVILAGIVAGATFWFSDFENNQPWVLITGLKGTEVIEKEEEKELIEGILVPIQHLDKELIKEKIEQGKEFLLRMEEEEEHGFHKYYYALEDELEKRLHTVYSASIIYTFLRIYDFDRDERILEKLPDWADFLLLMQSKEEETYGAFYYSYYYEKEEKETKFPVGTTALSIFTLLDLYDRTDEVKYLDSAKLGGNWLLTMQMENGVMRSQRVYKKGEWIYYDKESLLYNGQVLSALSRLYKKTQEEKYYKAAEKIAEHFVGRVEKEGCYLGDDYRSKNPISSAWVIMSLLDFYKINKEEKHKNIILNCSQELLDGQKTETNNPLYFGTWTGAYSTSGNGWLAEVMMEMYKFCKEENKEGCNKYKEALEKVIFWIIENTYSKENTHLLKNPERGIGGIFWNYKDKYVRTDSICHALNAYIGIFNDLEEGILVSIPGGR